MHRHTYTWICISLTDSTSRCLVGLSSSSTLPENIDRYLSLYIYIYIL